MVVTLSGNTQISTSQYKFGSSSIRLDGTGDYITVTDNGNFDFGTNDFTIEWWQRLDSLDRFAIDFRSGSSASNKILLYSYQYDGSADDIYLYTNANRISATNSDLTANQWQHIALVRSSNTTKLYINGMQQGNSYTDNNSYSHGEMRIWHNSIGAENYTPAGYIDEFRVSDSARYTSNNFSTPSARFEDDANTVFHLQGDGSNGSTDIQDTSPPYFEAGYFVEGYFEGSLSAATTHEGAATLSCSFTLSTEQTSNYFVPGYFEDGYFEGSITLAQTHEGAATLSASFTQTTNGTRVKLLNEGLTASFTQSSQGSRTRSTAITMTSSFGVSEAQPTRIKQLSATIGSALNATMTVVALKNHTAVLSSAVSFTATAVKNASNTTALANIISLSLQGDRTRATTSTFSSSFSQTTQAQKTTDTSSSQSAQLTQTTSGSRIRFGASTQTNTFTLSVSTAVVFEPSFTTSSIGGSTGLVAVTSLSNTITKFAGASATLAGAFTPSISALVTKVGEIVMSSQFRGRNNSDILAKPTILTRKLDITVNSPQSVFSLSSTYARFGAKSLQISTDTDGTSEDNINIRTASGYTDQLKNFKTVEYWFYQQNNNSTNAQSQWQIRFTDNASYTLGTLGFASYNNWYIEHQSQWNNGTPRLRTRVLFDTDLNPDLDTSSALFNNWIHVRVVIDDGKISIYQNGTRIAHDTSSTGLNTSNDHTISINALTNSSTFIDELRISDTALNDVDDTSITVPTKAFVNNLDSTLLLMHFDSAIDDDNEFAIVEAAALTSTTTQTTTANYGPGLLAGAIASQFTQTTTAIKNVGTSASVTATATQSTSVDVFRTTAVSVTAQSTLSASAVVTRQGASNQSVVISKTTTAVKTTDTSADFDAINTLLGAVAKIGDFLIAFDVAFSTSITAQKTTDITKTLSSAFTQTTDAIKNIDEQVNLSSAITQSTQGDRIRFGSSTQAITASLSCGAVETDDFTASITVTASLSCETSPLRSTGAELSSTHTSSITAVKKTDVSGTFASAFTQTISGQAGLFSDAELDSAFSLALTPSVTRTFDVDFDAVNTQITVAARTAAFFINHDLTMSMTTVNSRQRNTSATLGSAATVSTTVLRIKQLSANITATASIEAKGVTQAESESAMTLNFSQTVTPVKTVSAQANLQSDNAFALTALVARGGDIDLISTTSVQASADRTRDTSATKTVVVSVSTNAGKKVDGAASVSTTVTMSTDIIVIHTTDIVYVIPAETREFSIKTETRDITIDAEDREHKVLRLI